MAYFDSPKNRAMWEKELAGLRRERAEAMCGREKTADSRKKTADGDPKTADRGTLWAGRTKITFDQLLEDIHRKHSAGKLQGKEAHSEKRLSKERSLPEQKSRKGRSL